MSGPPFGSVFVARVALVVVLGLSASAASAQVRDAEDLAGERERDAVIEHRFQTEVLPLLAESCQDCHAGEDAEAKLDLMRFGSAQSVADEHQLWAIVLDRVERGEMPPEDASPMDESQRQRLVQWIRDLRQHEAVKHAGDPGIVLPRRLSNSEYNHVIRDLTGVDIKPTASFPVDAANEAGFDNSGESLSMTPALLNKYLAAARQIADHLVLQPTGFTFAPFPVVTDTDRDKFCVNRIVDFYRSQPTELSEYFFAAWLYQHRGVLKHEGKRLDEIAASRKVSGKYLQVIWELLQQPVRQDIEAPLVRVQSMWNALPTPDAAADESVAGESASIEAEVMVQCKAIGDYAMKIRRAVEPTLPNLEISGSNRGSQPLVLWKNRQYEAYRRSFDRSKLVDEGSDQVSDRFHPDLVVPSDPAKRAAYREAMTKFCEMIPDAFFISERGRDYVDTPKDQQEKGRLLSAGFHSMMGYYRDDAPLYDLALDEEGQRQLDRLWQELDFVALAPMRQYVGHLWFERTDSRFMRDEKFDFARPENKQSLTEPFIKRLAEVYYDHSVSRKASDTALEAVRVYYEQMNTRIRAVEAMKVAAEPTHVEALVAFAERAYRRPMRSDEKDDLISFYQSLRREESLSHEEAMQDALVSILMSPHFCFRMDLASRSATPQPLDDHELANRLSFFLWASAPDETLMRLADAKQLAAPEVLIEQVQRMVRDPRARSLATEFMANWLDIRRFEEHNSVDRARFPAFTDELRAAMFEEPLRFFGDLLVHDRSVLLLLDAPHTFVNEALARHYGMPGIDGGPDRESWVRIDDAREFHRGGLASMAVFLTKNSPGLRTSPVKRGYWVVKRLLGESIPAPPPNVPELPADESQLGERSLRQMLEAHRAHKDCAACHDKIDSIGLAFEAFGPVGEWRALDLGGRPVDTLAKFPDQVEREGVEGLREYLMTQRRDDFVDHFCRKLLTYALGRSLRLSDEPLIERMCDELAANDYRISVAFDCIVTSPQFLTKRGLVE